MDLQRICSIVKGLNKRSMNIDKNIVNFVLVRDKRCKKEVVLANPEDGEKYRLFAKCCKYLPSSEREWMNMGYHLIPICENQTEFYAVESISEKNIKLFDTPVFTLPKPALTAETKNVWANHPNEMLNTVLQFIDSPFYVVGSFMNCTVHPASDVKVLVDFLELAQRMRIRVGNTIVNNQFLTMGKEDYEKFKNGDSEEEKEKTLNKLENEYKNITEQIVQSLIDKKLSIPMELLQNVNSKLRSQVMENSENKITTNSFTKNQFLKREKTTELIPNFELYKMIDMYEKFKGIENEVAKVLEGAIKDYPIWTDYLSGIKGCGPKIAGYIIAKLDPRKANHPSGFISYCGLDVRTKPDGTVRGTDKTITTNTVYLDKNGDAQVNKGLGYDPVLKSKIVFLLNESVMKAGGKYADIYRAAKNYYENRPDLKEVFADKKNSRTAAKMARRKTASLFLVDLWIAWRRLEGLPLNGGTYAEEKLHIVHNYDRPTLEYIQAGNKY